MFFYVTATATFHQSGYIPPPRGLGRRLTYNGRPGEETPAWIHILASFRNTCPSPSQERAGPCTKTALIRSCYVVEQSAPPAVYHAISCSRYFAALLRRRPVVVNSPLLSLFSFSGCLPVSLSLGLSVSLPVFLSVSVCLFPLVSCLSPLPPPPLSHACARACSYRNTPRSPSLPGPPSQD